ncbi:MAG: hypothetical protein CVV21_07140 [Candidatus Goldiibacteriota bacterium HGW-Goldbacteria-1]|jgi:hypothetical protein|nr:MAG: hypothetical protein CVV21_07140 [Candidatus Goldiibacteriota bacterium HGW-Goldbacteria-1]
MRACGIPTEYVFASFIVFWIVLSYLISLVSGWGTIAKYYRRPEGMMLTRAKGFLTSLYLNRSSYKKSVYIRVDDLGMHLSVLLFFRFGHPPLFVPWSDIKIEERQSHIAGKSHYISFSKTPLIRISMNESALEKLNILGRYKFPT